MRLLLISLFLLLLVVPAYSQAPKTPFVKLKFGEPLLGTRVFADAGVFSIKSVSVDDSTFDESMVMYFRNSQGLLYGSVNGRLRPAVHEDKMIIFMIQGSYTSFGPPGPGFGLSLMRSKNRFFYSMGMEPVRKVTINNLQMDVHTNAEAFKFLTQAKKFRTATFISYGVGLGALVYIFTTPTVTSSGSGLSTTGRQQYTIAASVMLGGLISGAICNAFKWYKVSRSVQAYSGYQMFR